MSERNWFNYDEPPDDREEQIMSEQQSLKELACECAKAKPQSYYAEPFEPHPWVMDAVNAAYLRGLEDAAKIAESKEYRDWDSGDECAKAIRALKERK